MSSSGWRNHVEAINAEDGHDSDDPKQNTTDMAAFDFDENVEQTDIVAAIRKGREILLQVQNLLQQMRTRFQAMSENTVTKIDEMGNRIDEPEQSIKDLKSEMGPDDSSSPVPPSKSKPDDSKPEDSSTNTAE